MPDLLFLLGSPRSGKSTTHDILASTGEFAWISNFQSSYPNLHFISLFNRKYDIPYLGLKLYSNKKEKDITSPVQSNDFWKFYLKGFEPRRGRNNNSVPIEQRKPPGIILGENITEVEKRSTREVVKNICRWQGKDHFLAEYALWARMSYFSKIFPQAKFLHILRDGRAVASEYKKMIEKGVYPESDEIEWWLSGWPKEWREEFKENYGSLLTFCVFQWKFILKMIWRDANDISKKRYMEVMYKDIVEEPEKTFSNILDFYDLKCNSRIERYLKRKELENMNRRWREELDGKEKEHLDQIIHEEEYLKILNHE